jgi:serine/threonine-protein kinase
MNNRGRPPDALSPSGKGKLEEVIDKFEKLLKAQQRPRIEAHLNYEPKAGDYLLERLLEVEWEYRKERGEWPTTDEYLVRFPNCKEIIDHVALGRTARSAASDEPRLGPNDLSQHGYDHVSLIGQGGMGVVYSARHTRLGRDVAIKMIRGRCGQNELDRFQHEAKALASLRHPHIVTIHHFDVYRPDEQSAGQPFLVLELVTGGSLRDRIRKGGRLDSRSAAEVMFPVARAVAYANGQGVFHRDLKPENVLLEGDTPKVADFGLAALRTSDYAAGGPDAPPRRQRRWWARLRTCPRSKPVVCQRTR